MLSEYFELDQKDINQDKFSWAWFEKNHKSAFIYAEKNNILVNLYKRNTFTYTNTIIIKISEVSDYKKLKFFIDLYKSNIHICFFDEFNPNDYYLLYVYEGNIGFFNDEIRNQIENHLILQ